MFSILLFAAHHASYKYSVHVLHSILAEIGFKADPFPFQKKKSCPRLFERKYLCVEVFEKENLKRKLNKTKNWNSMQFHQNARTEF